MKLTIKESFKEERGKPETIFLSSCQNLRGIDQKPDEMDNIMYLCEGKHSEPNLEFSEFLNWT